MQKNAFIATALLLSLSLGTSIYLILDQRKDNADLENLKNDSDKKTKAHKKLAEEIKKVETERNNAKKELTSTKRTSDINKSYKTKYDYLKANNDEKYEELRFELAEADKNSATLQVEKAALDSTNKIIRATLDKAREQSTSYKAQLDKQGKQFEGKDKEIFDLTERIKKMEKHGLTPAHNPEINNDPSETLKDPGISRPKRKPPGKLTKPLAGPGPR